VRRYYGIETLEDFTTHNIEKIKSRIEINKKHIDSHEDIRVALQYAINALSPTEGIIAKSINSFINVFLNEMNTIINSVWSYELTLLPCQINESNDLDYLFAVKVADNKKDIKDVAYLSTSMKDIVDLSFKIVFMKYMKLTHMPLMLDEFGVFMDDTHRNKVYDVIENLLSNNFSQIYFTANFKSIYGRFVDSDINILDDKNLELDDIFYNENLKIVKK
jgi:DNA repair exonuclease SbcCD ATPase subunit